MGRVAVSLTTFVIVLTVVLVGAVRMMPRSVIATAERSMAESASIESALEAARTATAPHVVWLGDSSFVGAPGTDHPRLVTERLQPTMPHDSTIIAAAGLDFYWYYCLMGEVLATRPAVVVLMANPVQLTTGPTSRVVVDLCGYIPLGDLPRALLLPWGERGVTTADLINARWPRGMARHDMRTRVRGMQLLGQRWLPISIATRPPRQQRWFAVLRRGNERQRGFDLFREAWKETLAARLDRESPMMVMLDATIRMATRAGIPTVVIGNPVPASVRDDPAPLRERFPLRAIVENAGGRFLDLHDLLTEEQFRDGLVHFTKAGAEAIAARVEPVVREYLVRGQRPVPATPRDSDRAS